MAPHTPEEPQGGQHLVLGQQDFHDLIVRRRESLERSSSEREHSRRLLAVNVGAPYLQHVQRQLVSRRVEALQGQQQTRLKDRFRLFSTRCWTRLTPGIPGDTHQRLGVAEHVVLQELVQRVEEVVLD